MFHKFIVWLKGLLGKWAEDRYDVYHPRERSIYRYWNGSVEIKADPITLYKRVMAVGPELGIEIKIASSMSKDARKSHDSMIQKIRDIFGVKRFEEGGLTEMETINLFDAFITYVEWVKKNSSLLPNSLTSSGDSPSSSVEGPPTSSSSDSGSVASDSSTAPQVPSLSEPELPSEA